LKVRHVGQFGAHATAKKAGFQLNDILVSVDNRTGRVDESLLILQLLNTKRPGDLVPITVLRDGQRVDLTLPMPPQG
jgi:S1-C subfamily serine protease